MAPAQASLLAKLDTQERVRDFLTNAVASGRASHAYLFLGAPGAGKLDAAWALAQAFLCEQDGCGACDSCVRVARHTHPDVHYYTPESATGYLIAQTRELLDDVPLAPIRAKAKVYIIDRAEQLRANTANALLKTLVSAGVARRGRACRESRHRSGPCALPHSRRRSGKPHAWHRVPQERRAPGCSPPDGPCHRFAHRRRRGRCAQPRQVAHRRR